MGRFAQIDKDTIMCMTPNMCIRLFEEQQREIKRLTQLVEKQGKKCHRYQKMLAAAHFGGEDKIPRKTVTHRAGPRVFAGSRWPGYYSYFENGKVVIEYHTVREGRILYRGEYKGEQTPYLSEIKKENVRMYNSIMKFFESE
jgi:hypothetical protein